MWANRQTLPHSKACESRCMRSRLIKQRIKSPSCSLLGTQLWHLELCCILGKSPHTTYSTSRSEIHRPGGGCFKKSCFHIPRSETRSSLMEESEAKPFWLLEEAFSAACLVFTCFPRYYATTLYFFMFLNIYRVGIIEDIFLNQDGCVLHWKYKFFYHSFVLNYIDLSNFIMKCFYSYLSEISGFFTQSMNNKHVLT